MMSVSQFEMSEGDQNRRAMGEIRFFPESSVREVVGEEPIEIPRFGITNLPVIDFEMQRRLGTIPLSPVHRTGEFQGLVDPSPVTREEVVAPVLGEFAKRQIIEVEYPLVGEFHD